MQNLLLHILIALYFVINSFGSGYYLGEKFKFAGTKNEEYNLIKMAIFLFLFLIPLLIIAGISVFFDWLNEKFLLLIFWRVYFTKYYQNCSKKDLEQFNKAMENYMSKTENSPKIGLFLIKKINQLNNYTPSKT